MGQEGQHWDKSRFIQRIKGKFRKGLMQGTMHLREAKGE